MFCRQVIPQWSLASFMTLPITLDIDNKRFMHKASDYRECKPVDRISVTERTS